ncbi:hypothetical protein DRQ07_03120 [candidate division KSB1 bacterium]|nr:MAG: hypothetical protein DRQ07_03120 [candidate division KSB1 bacterium]
MNKLIPVFLFIILSPFLFTCYNGHGLSPFVSEMNGTGIKGHITFTGKWPDSTKEVRVAVLDKYPEGISDPDSLMGFVLNNLIALSDTIPRFVNEYDYFITAEEGFYEWVVVVWFPDIPLYLFGVRELGAYYSSTDDTKPCPVYISKGSVISGIDITADFKNLENNAPFFKRNKK